MSKSFYTVYGNNSINKKMNVSYLMDHQSKINNYEKNIVDSKVKYEEILKSKWMDESVLYKLVIITVAIISSIVVSFGLSIIGAFVNDMIAGLMGIIGVFIGSYYTPTLIGFKKLKTKRADEYLKKMTEKFNNQLNVLEHEKEVMKNTVNYLTEKYGPEIANNMVNRNPVKGLPLDKFVMFFGSPQSIETTEDTTTFIYGTSKRAGDWFRFKNDKLVTFNIK